MPIISNGPLHASLYSPGFHSRMALVPAAHLPGDADLSGLESLHFGAACGRLVHVFQALHKDAAGNG